MSSETNIKDSEALFFTCIPDGNMLLISIFNRCFSIPFQCKDTICPCNIGLTTHDMPPGGYSYTPNPVNQISHSNVSKRYNTKGFTIFAL